MRVLVTGGCGFIGSHFVRLLLQKPEVSCIGNVDCETYAAHPITAEELRRLAPARYQQFSYDIASSDLVKAFELSWDAVVHFAAESHVDRSLLDAADFVRTNVLGTQALLSLCRKHGDIPLLYVSTDEVYGTLSPDEDAFTENHPLRPNSPYSASKASGDLLVRAAYQSFRQKVLVSRCSNNYGPYQFPEKFIPVAILRALGNSKIPIYGDGLQVRDWIHVEDHCTALWEILTRGKPGEIYNIGSDCEKTNLEVVHTLLEILEKPKDLLQHIQDRPGHDRRYALNTEKIQSELGWTPQKDFEQGLRETIAWYQNRSDWLRAAQEARLEKYFHANYAQKGLEHP